jgi:hypothetical protein
MTTYSERLTVSLRWWVQATMFLATVWLAFIVAMPAWAAWTATLVAVAIVYGLFLVMGSARIRVADGMLHAGPARISTDLIGRPEPLDKDATRRVLGVDADVRAFLLTRPWLRRSVRVPIEDPADPTPYWLISSRRPGELAEAIRRARDVTPR